MARQVLQSLEGLQGVFAALRGLERAARTKAMRRAVGEPAKAVLRAAKAKASIDTGLLRRSLGRKVKVYKGGLVAFAIVGSRKEGFRAQAGTRVRGRRAGEPFFRWPVKYLHLVERGTRHSAARPFIEPAFRANETAIREQVIEIVAEELGRAAGAAGG